MLEYSQPSVPAPCLGASEGVPSPPLGLPPSNSTLREPPKTGSYAHKNLQARHHKMAELASQGVNNKQIAEQLGMSQSSVSLNIRSPLVQNLIASLREGRNRVIQESAIKLNSLAPQAVDLYERYIDKHNDELAPRDKAKLAGDILKTAGIGVEEKAQTTQIFITAEELAGIRERASESPKYIEADVLQEDPGPVAFDESSEGAESEELS